MHKQKKKDTEIDTAPDNDIVIPMYNLIEYSGNYSKHLEVELQRWTKMITQNYLNIKQK